MATSRLVIDRRRHDQLSRQRPFIDIDRISVDYGLTEASNGWLSQFGIAIFLPIIIDLIQLFIPKRKRSKKIEFVIQCFWTKLSRLLLFCSQLSHFNQGLQNVDLVYNLWLQWLNIVQPVTRSSISTAQFIFLYIKYLI